MNFLIGPIDLPDGTPISVREYIGGPIDLPDGAPNSIWKYIGEPIDLFAVVCIAENMNLYYMRGESSALPPHPPSYTMVVSGGGGKPDEKWLKNDSKMVPKGF